MTLVPSPTLVSISWLSKPGFGVPVGTVSGFDPLCGLKLLVFPTKLGLVLGLKLTVGRL